MLLLGLGLGLKPLPNTDLTWRERGEGSALREGKLEGRKSEKEEGERRKNEIEGRRS